MKNCQKSVIKTPIYMGKVDYCILRFKSNGLWFKGLQRFDKIWQYFSFRKFNPNFSLSLPIDVNRLGLTKSEYTKDALDIVRWVPAGIEDYNTIGGDKVDAESSSLGGDEEESHPEVCGLVEVFAPDFPSIGSCWTIHSVIIFSWQPRVKVFSHGRVSCSRWRLMSFIDTSQEFFNQVKR